MRAPGSRDTKRLAALQEQLRNDSLWSLLDAETARQLRAEAADAVAMLVEELRVHDENRFWEQVSKQADGCWIWTGRTSHFGHGSFRTRGRKTRYAHRVAWEFSKGPIPSGVLVLHKCDVPACVNPDHLFLGSQSDNIVDAVKKGRWTQARMTHKRKLSLENLHEIDRLKSEGMTQAAIARRFGVDPATISHAVNRNLRWHRELMEAR